MTSHSEKSPTVTTDDVQLTLPNTVFNTMFNPLSKLFKPKSNMTPFQQMISSRKNIQDKLFNNSNW